MTATGLLELSHLAKSYYSVRREGPNSDHQCQMRFPWASDWTMAPLADVLEVAVGRPQTLETTPVGVAWLAGSRPSISGPTARSSPKLGAWTAVSNRVWTRPSARP